MNEDQDLSNRIKQQYLDVTHKRATEQIQRYVSGLITFNELANGFEHLSENLKTIGSCDGLLCPNTGIRFR